MLMWEKVNFYGKLLRVLVGGSSCPSTSQPRVKGCQMLLKRVLTNRSGG